MAETENQAVTSYRDQLRARAMQRYPDRSFDATGGENGENGEALEQAIMDMLTEQDTRIDDYDSKNKRLVELFMTDPKSAQFIQTWMETGDPRPALVAAFGDELGDLATEEGRERFSGELADWRGRREESDRMAAEAAANWKKSLEDLDAWGDSKGLTDEQKVEVIGRLVKIADDGMQNKYSPEDFDLVVKEMNFDSAVEAAREEGEVAGRNAKIESRRRSKNDVLPPSLSGQGMRVQEAQPERPKSIWSDIR